MIQQFAFFCIAPDQVDAEVGEDGEENKNDGCHQGIALGAVRAGEDGGLSL